MTDSPPQETALKKRMIPPSLDLSNSTPRRRRSSGLPPLTPLTSTRTPTSRRKWPSTPTKIHKPTSDKILFQRALAELTLEEEERKAANERVVEKNSGIEVTGFGGVDAEKRERKMREIEVKSRKKVEMDQLLSRTYDEYRPPVDVEQGSMEVPLRPKGRGLNAAPKGKVPSASTKSANLSTKSEPFVPIDPCEGIVPVFPSIAIGAKETTPLSKIGRADREVKLWEEAVQTYEINQPSLVPVGEEQLLKAKEARGALDESLEENTRIGDIDAAASAIAQRISALEWGLRTSNFVPEKANIQAAISAYKSGLIPFSEKYTLIYASQIVETVPDYATFIHDRPTRLDRYEALHGPGWLWYEPPLAIHPETRIRASLGVSLSRDPAWHMLAPYYVHQGFWKRSGFVQRCPSSWHFGLAPQEVSFLRNEEGKVWCQEDGAPLAFRTMLDSGATFPSLHSEDLLRLGIDPHLYGAQSLDTVMTAAGPIACQVYELVVCVLDDECNQLVKNSEAVWPYSFKYLGGITPVIELAQPITYDALGQEQNGRLSGLLPFLACYVASTPTRSVLHLGEDRNDVLGHQRMPGQRKWAVDMTPIMPNPFKVMKFGDPLITFSHRKGVFLDKDDEEVRHKSVITVNLEGGGEFVKISHPVAMQEKALGVWGNKPSFSPLVPGEDPLGPFAREGEVKEEEGL